VADARAARDGGAVLALSRTDPASVAELRGWVLGLLEAHRSGNHTPQDPGPMAPHFHADEDGGTVHTHEHADHPHSH
ncbi:MAG: urease accessory protein, partial [Actinomycetota bacterium]|nr:urease accessory protein [Actinomycetota bacterium]